MSSTQIRDTSNEESSAGKFGDQPALLSGPNSNQAEGGTMIITSTAEAATLADLSTVKIIHVEGADPIYVPLAKQIADIF